MPNLSAAKKSLRADERKRLYNLRRNRAVKSHVKDVLDSVKSGNLDKAQESLPLAYKAIDKAAKRGILKRNTAARRKSSLAKAIASAEK